MSSNSILHSVESERRWALEIDNNFPKEHIVDIDFDTPTCVFRVPKSLSETKPEAYAPQLLGLGPYHHLRPDFYMMQKQKLSAVRRYLSAEKLQDFNQVVEALIQWEPVLRACYDQYLDFDIRTLARILAIDALYLLQFFEARKSGEVAEMDKMAGDIMMLENQIPVILLEKIVCVLGKEDLVDHALFREFKVFCEAYSPLKLNQHQQITEENKTLLHLLHCMYYLIVTNTCIKETMTLELATGRKIEGGISIEEAAEISIEEPRLLSIKEEVISIEATAEISIEETLEVSIEEAGEISIEETVEISIEEPRRLSIKEVISTEEAAAGLSIEEPRLVSITEEVIAIEDAAGISIDEATGLSIKETMMPIEVSYTRVSVQEVEGVVIPFMVESGVPGAATAGRILSFIEKVPLDRILALFKKDGSDQQFPSVEEIDIPTVSQMSETAGIKFKLTPGGIRDSKYDDRGEEKIFYLPSIRLDANSEVILRSLVAYEAASAKPGSTLELAEYVDLMCGIIDTNKDVDILKQEKIIEGELPDEEIVRIFNGIRKSTGKTDEKSNVEKAIDNINESYNNLVIVKVKEVLKKYVYASWKFLSVLITVAVLVLLTLNAFCSVFGCGRWFGKGTTTQIHNLLFSDQ